MNNTLVSDERVLLVWQWCSDAYLQHGFKIKFPKATDCAKTYQWRFAKAIATKFNEWDFDEATAKRFIWIAVAQAKMRGVLKKGLAAVHQSNMLNICYQILTQEQIDNNNTLNSLTSMKSWFDDKIGSADPLTVLLHRSNARAFSNFTIWYRGNQISDHFIAISKVCSKALVHTQSNALEARLLPPLTSLYLLRAEFLSDAHNEKVTKQLFGSDWRSP